MIRRANFKLPSLMARGSRFRRQWLSAGMTIIVIALLLAVTAGTHRSSATPADPTVKNASVQYYTVNNLANPGFSASASVACPAGTFLVGGYHVTPAGADLISEGVSGNAWVVTAAGSGTTPVFFSSVASCLSVPSNPSLQTVQGTITGMVTGSVTSPTIPSVTEPPQSLTLPLVFTGAPGYPWSLSNAGSLTYTITVALITGGSLSITLTASGTAVGEYTVATGEFVEKVMLHASSAFGSLDLPITLTTGTSSSGAVSLTGSPVNAQGNVTIVGVGTTQNGTGLVGTVFSGATIALTFTGTVANFPNK
jgi:hypothetical protein